MNKTIIILIGVAAVIGVGFLLFNRGGGNEGIVEQTNTPLATAQTTTSTTPAPSPTPTPTATVFSLASIAEHKTAQSCWSVVNNKVYDLTNWVSKHPGGPEKIISICGKDGSSAFNKQHGGKEKPENQLKNFYIGDLAQ